MEKLFVEQSIVINAPAAIVWEVLTHADLNVQWIREWWPEIKEVRSEWKTAGPVTWITEDGETGAEGKVFISSPPVMLSFSFKVNGLEMEKQEDITYKLEETECDTTLHVSVGDFGDTPEHMACYPGAVESWEKSLPQIKRLAEQSIVQL
jgi:uncharacterized protein YndB with AHSA1/START domain